MLFRSCISGENRSPDGMSGLPYECTIGRNGHKHGKQAFLCRACGKSYVTTSNTLLSSSHYSSVVWKTVLADTLMGVSLGDTGDGLKLRHIKISHTRLFFMRHKIMLVLEDLQEISPAMIEDVVEADETYVPESEKGTKFGPGAKRNPRKRGTPTAKPSAVFLTSRSASALQFSVKAAIWLYNQRTEQSLPQRMSLISTQVMLRGEPCYSRME